MGATDHLKPIDLDQTTPTLLPDKLREAGDVALKKAVDPLNVLDNNPFIGREWLLVGLVFKIMAKDLEDRLIDLFTYDPCDDPPPRPPKGWP